MDAVCACNTLSYSASIIYEKYDVYHIGTLKMNCRDEFCANATSALSECNRKRLLLLLTKIHRYKGIKYYNKQ